MDKPLSGLRIVDFSMVYAGPLCAAMLGALGAEVIKVESGARLDQTRTRRGKPEDVNIDADRTYHIYNHNKRSIALNLQAPGAVDLAKRLIQQSDIVIEAFRPGVMKRLGLDYESLRAIHPKLLMLSISGNGQTGPDAEGGAYAAIFAAQGGLGYLTGYPGGMPTEWRASVDLRVGTAAFVAILAGIDRLLATGEGGHIDVAGREVVGIALGETFIAAQSSTEPLGPTANDDRVMAPCGCFVTDDPETWISLAVATDEEWSRLCSVAGWADLATDPRFADGFRRWRHREELNEIVRAWMQQQDAPTILERLRAAGVVCAPTLRIDQLAGSPHLAARNLWQQYTLPATVEPGEGEEIEVPVVGAPWSFDHADDFYEVKRAPAFGADNEYVFMDVLGLPRSEYDDLICKKVIA